MLFWEVCFRALAFALGSRGIEDSLWRGCVGVFTFLVIRRIVKFLSMGCLVSRRIFFWRS